MNTKNIIVTVGVGAGLLLGAASWVLAQDTMTRQPNPVPAQKAQLMVLEIGPAGNVLLRGTVSAVNGSTLTVKSWGGDWTVNAASAQMMPTASATQFEVGNFVGVQGAINTGAPWTIDAKLVRNWTDKKMMQGDRMMQKTQAHEGETKDESMKTAPGSPKNTDSQGMQQQIQSILERIKKIQEQINQQHPSTAPTTAQ
jgi:hypothetical protein